MKKVDTNSNLLKGEKNGKYLIKLPKSEFMFWHPKELVHFSGKKNYLMTISYEEGKYIHVFRNGNGKYNRDQVMDEMCLTTSMWEKYFYQYKVA
jgi:hypothetical protein